MAVREGSGAIDSGNEKRRYFGKVDRKDACVYRVWYVVVAVRSARRDRSTNGWTPSMRDVNLNERCSGVGRLVGYFLLSNLSRVNFHHLRLLRSFDGNVRINFFHPFILSL